MRFATLMLVAGCQALGDIKTIFGQRTNPTTKHPLASHPDVQTLAFPDAGSVSVRLTKNMKSPDVNFSRYQTAVPEQVGLAAGDSQITFLNYGNFYYTAPMYLGASLTSFNMLYDSGSPEVTIGVKTCLGCPGKLYDFSTSGTFSWTNPAETETINYYDGTSL